MNIPLILAASALLAHAAPEIPTAADFRKSGMRNGNLHNTDGEQFCWHASGLAEKLLLGYEATGDTAWLDETLAYFGFLDGNRSLDPDGYPGWIGRGIYDKGKEPAYLTDALVGDAILLQPMVRFAEIVLADRELTARYGERANERIALATRIGWEKWNQRGCYHRSAAGFGSYHTHTKVIDPGTGKWVPSPGLPTSDNLNKHSAMGLVILGLHRIGPDDGYRDRVVEIFARLKSMFRHFPEDDRVSWNFWMPHGTYDIRGSRLASWVAVHPDRAGYQATEVANMVEVYDSGLVFDRADLQRLINANHYMTHGGKWRSSDGSSAAGTLWSSLARFDERIASAYLERLGSSAHGDKALELAAFRKTLAPLGDQRRFVADPKRISVFDHPPQPGRALSMTEIIPDLIETANDDRARLITQSKASGPLKIELLDLDGKVLGTLHESAATGESAIIMPEWDGTHPQTGKKEPGDYLVRWTLADDVRTALVFVRIGAKRADTGPPAMSVGSVGPRPAAKPLQPGQTLGFDFETPLDAAWQTKSASISTARAAGGKSSLTLAPGGSATLSFSNGPALPVRVSFQIYDPGEKHGSAPVSGPGWGIAKADGEFVGPVLFWRKFLGTDKNHAWIDTADGAWASPGYLRLPRKTGWSEWTFDFTDPDSPKVTRDGKPVDFKPEALGPGATAVHFRQGSGKLPIHIDDLRIEYPE